MKERRFSSVSFILSLVMGICVLGTSVSAFAFPINVGYTAALGTLDPHTTTYTDVVAVRFHIFESLVWYETQGTDIGLQPRLATSWELSADGRTYTFNLRKGVKFQDGAEFNAQAVKANIDRLTGPSWTSAIKDHWRAVEKSEVIDEYTISITLKSPNNAFLNLLGSHSGLLVSPRAIAEYGDEYGGLDKALIGTGPFMVSSRIQGEQLVLKRFEGYWGVKPEVDTITYYIVPESNSRISMLQTGQLDIVIRITPEQAEKVNTIKGINVVMTATNRPIYFSINTQHPPLDNILIRKAINYAVNKRAIVDNLFAGSAQIADCPIAPSVFGYGHIMTYDYNPEKARQLLAEAGFPEGKGLRKITMLTIHGRYTSDYLVAQSVQADLKQTGFDVDLKEVGDMPQYLQMIGAPEERADMMLLGWAASTMEPVSGMRNILHPDVANKFANASGWEDEYFGELFDEAASTSNLEESDRLYRLCMEYVMDQAPLVFLYYQPVYNAIRGNIEGSQLDPAEHLLLWGCHLGAK